MKKLLTILLLTPFLASAIPQVYFFWNPALYDPTLQFTGIYTTNFATGNWVQFTNFPAIPGQAMYVLNPPNPSPSDFYQVISTTSFGSATSNVAFTVPPTVTLSITNK